MRRLIAVKSAELIRETRASGHVCLETLESHMVTAENFGTFMRVIDPSHVGFQEFLTARIIHYMNPYISCLVDSPEQTTGSG